MKTVDIAVRIIVVFIVRHPLNWGFAAVRDEPGDGVYHGGVTENPVMAEASGGHQPAPGPGSGEALSVVVGHLTILQVMDDKQRDVQFRGERRAFRFLEAGAEPFLHKGLSGLGGPPREAEILRGPIQVVAGVLRRRDIHGPGHPNPPREGHGCCRSAE